MSPATGRTRGHAPQDDEDKKGGDCAEDREKAFGCSSVVVSWQFSK